MNCDLWLVTWHVVDFGVIRHLKCFEICFWQRRLYRLLLNHLRYLRFCLEQCYSDAQMRRKNIKSFKLKRISTRICTHSVSYFHFLYWVFLALNIRRFILRKRQEATVLLMPSLQVLTKFQRNAILSVRNTGTLLIDMLKSKSEVHILWSRVRVDRWCSIIYCDYANVIY